MEVDFRKTIDSLKSGNHEPVYFLKGDDRYLQRFFVSTVENSIFTDGDTNTFRLNPVEMGHQEIIDRINYVDLFASKSVYVLQQSQLVKGNQRKLLLEYCKSPIHTNCLIILHDEWRLRSKVLQQIESHSCSVSVSTPMENGVKRWARYFFREQGVKVSDDVINNIVDFSGDSLDHLHNEIEKICISLDDKEIVTVEKVKSYSGWQREYQKWEFFLSLGEKKYDKAIALGKRLVTQNESLVALLWGLSSFHQELLYSKNSHGTSRAYPGYTGLPPSVNKRIPQFAKARTKKEIEKALLLLSELDKRIKSQSIDDETELLKFLINIQSNHD